jgi:protein phosphatase
VSDLVPRYMRRLQRLEKYQEALSPLLLACAFARGHRLAPFHLLASESAVHVDKTHRWHMETLHRLSPVDPAFVLATPFLEIEVANEAAVETASQWCETLTGKGGEGMVVKPLDFVVRGAKGMVQLAL